MDYSVVIDIYPRRHQSNRLPSLVTTFSYRLGDLPVISYEILMELAFWNGYFPIIKTFFNGQSTMFRSCSQLENSISFGGFPNFDERETASQLVELVTVRWLYDDNHQ